MILHEGSSIDPRLRSSLSSFFGALAGVHGCELCAHSRFLPGCLCSSPSAYQLSSRLLCAVLIKDTEWRKEFALSSSAMFRHIKEAMEGGKTFAGASASVATPPPQLLCLSLHESDKIRVMNLAAPSIEAFRACIQSSWPSGIQSEGLYGISYQFKLKGRPWAGNGEQANGARILMAGIFRFLLQSGWTLRLTTDVSKWVWDKDTFFFKQDAPPDPTVQVCAISFNRGDRIRVLDGPPEVAQVVRQCAQSFWHRGLKHEATYFGAPEFKLHGNPWTPSGTDTMQTRMFVGQMIEALDRVGWEVYASVDISVGSAGGDSVVDDLDSWILRSRCAPSPQLGIPVPGPIQAQPKQFSDSQW